MIFAFDEFDSMDPQVAVYYNAGYGSGRILQSDLWLPMRLPHSRAWSSPRNLHTTREWATFSHTASAQWDPNWGRGVKGGQWGGSKSSGDYVPVVLSGDHFPGP